MSYTVSPLRMAYPTDLTDDHREIIQPLLPSATRRKARAGPKLNLYRLDMGQI
jgi:hypothetical protein